MSIVLRLGRFEQPPSNHKERNVYKESMDAPGLMNRLFDDKQRRVWNEQRNDFVLCTFRD